MNLSKRKEKFTSKMDEEILKQKKNYENMEKDQIRNITRLETACKTTEDSVKLKFY